MKTISLFFLFTSPLWAYPSLLFTEKEVHLIQQNIAAQNELKKTDSNSEGLYLSGIVYVNEDHWSIWLNNKLIGSDGQHQIGDFHIEKVSPYKVKFSRVSLQSAISFILHPNQMFSPDKNRVFNFSEN